MIPALANHLIQSTLFTAAIGILTLLLRNNRARVRYWLWLSASIKFLIPFSLLVTMGEWLKPATLTSPLPSAVTVALNEFTTPSLMTPAHTIAPTTSILPTVLIALWVTGFIASLTIWVLRWNRIRSVFRRSSPLTTGREAASLERVTRARNSVDLVLSRQPMEPVVFGIILETAVTSEN
jgi:beta-lactamase regulating signal transducer with metallopeptidase domain